VRQTEHSGRYRRGLPEGEEKTNVIVRLVENKNLIVTFKDWPALEGSDPPGAALWKQQHGCAADSSGMPSYSKPFYCSMSPS